MWLLQFSHFKTFFLKIFQIIIDFRIWLSVSILQVENFFLPVGEKKKKINACYSSFDVLPPTFFPDKLQKFSLLLNLCTCAVALNFNLCKFTTKYSIAKSSIKNRIAFPLKKQQNCIRVVPPPFVKKKTKDKNSFSIPFCSNQDKNQHHDDYRTRG